MKKTLGDFLCEMVYKDERSKMWTIFDNDHNLIASESIFRLWGALGVMFMIAPIKEVIFEDRIIILKCKYTIKEE